ncbi:MAG: VOC family protein [Saprospiraceae bacterium]
MHGFSSIVNAMSHGNQDKQGPDEFANYGAVHLNITNLEKSAQFWTKIAGMKPRNSAGNMAEFGTEDKTLVVLHETATKPFKKGFSGLYHLAIHAPNAAEFANMLHRLNENRYPYSPVDHTMSKSIYLDDPDGINVEFTLETPERFKRVITTGGIRMEGTDGVIRSASDRLDLNEVLAALKDKNTDRIISNDSYLGHIHLYANNVENSSAFYKQMGFQESNYLPQYMFADLGAGGSYTHRIVMNSWHGRNRPLAPEGTAGMRHFQINFREENRLQSALSNVENYEKTAGGYWIYDPTGNKIFTTLLS